MICQQIAAIAKVEANDLANKYAREYNCKLHRRFNMKGEVKYGIR